MSKVVAEYDYYTLDQAREILKRDYLAKRKYRKQLYLYLQKIFSVLTGVFSLIGMFVSNHPWEILGIICLFLYFADEPIL